MRDIEEYSPNCKKLTQRQCEDEYDAECFFVNGKKRKYCRSLGNRKKQSTKKNKSKSFCKNQMKNNCNAPNCKYILRKTKYTNGYCRTLKNKPRRKPRKISSSVMRSIFGSDTD